MSDFSFILFLIILFTNFLSYKMGRDSEKERNFFMVRELFRVGLGYTDSQILDFLNNVNNKLAKTKGK